MWRELCMWKRRGSISQSSRCRALGPTHPQFIWFFDAQCSGDDPTIRLDIQGVGTCPSVSGRIGER